MKRYLILFLFTFQGLLAQVQFEARVSKNTLGLNERFRIDFMMNVDGDNFDQPSFEGFRIVGGPSQQVSQSWINGRSSFQKIYSYILQPEKKGTFTIKQAAIEYNGQIYKTAPIKIVVTNAVAQERDPNDSGRPQGTSTGDEMLNLVAEISKTNPYLNEPITVVYKLYFNYINVTGFKELAKPKYNDFWNQNIDIKQLAVEQGSYQGQRCYYVVLKKTILYPQKSGRLTIEPLSLDIGVQLPSNRRDMFGQMIVTDGNKVVSAGAKTINVRPLPEATKPEGFGGAVGKFDFTVTPSKTTLKSGESLDLIVSASGNGNMKLFTLPKPVVPNALEMYDPVHDEKVTTSLSGMSGKITDKYTIVPQYKGKYAIKPMQFSYFDLNTGSYKTITSPEIMVDVLDGPMQAEANATAAKNVISKTEQFKYIKPKTTLTAIARNDFYGSNLYYGLLFLPFVIIPIIVLAKKRKEAIDGDVTGNRIRMNNKLAKRYLSEAKKQLNNKEPFYIALEKAMHNFLKAKLHIETSEMSKDNIRELLLSRNSNPETVQNFINLTENCEFARYAPASSASIQQDYDKAVLIISELEKQIV
ncbi:oxygen tolerance protein BatD [Flavobacterium sp. 90]|uniref:BatD family protein n=1 Tax=unclassified Flavobacterium TaxID=196869 RepID=UPI000EABFC84|nr:MULTISPECIES: BatD family protein [unclassified Flavobacterium]RKR10531.1 oxygen tolerance protein BatD [Flavobacterium sp. 81]TCK54316.1 oxygen tolerance protein BatD [Flavobacterium sp. 90]